MDLPTSVRTSLSGAYVARAMPARPDSNPAMISDSASSPIESLSRLSLIPAHCAPQRPFRRESSSSGRAIEATTRARIGASVKAPSAPASNRKRRFRPHRCGGVTAPNALSVAMPLAVAMVWGSLNFKLSAPPDMKVTSDWSSTRMAEPSSLDPRQAFRIDEMAAAKKASIRASSRPPPTDCWQPSFSG